MSTLRRVREAARKEAAWRLRKREAIRDAELEGRPQVEIADAAGVSQQAVSRMLQRLRS